MKPIFFGMNILQLITAIIVGLLIALVMVGSSVPKPVEVPVQVITPVPTPPPVVITEAPQVASGGSIDSLLLLGDTLDLVFFAWVWYPWLMIPFFLWGIIVFMRGFRGNDGDY